MIEFSRLRAGLLALVLAASAGCMDSRGGPIAYDKALAPPDAPKLATLESDYRIAPALFATDRGPRRRR